MIKRVCGTLLITLALLAGSTAMTPDSSEIASTPSPAPSGIGWG